MGAAVNLEFRKALEKKRILPFSRGKTLVARELEGAEEDLREAADRFKNGRYKYATITAYYSMFHSARALIYSKGYREKSHYYLLVALQALFADAGILEEELVRDFHTTMVLREGADYHGEFSQEGAPSPDAGRHGTRGDMGVTWKMPKCQAPSPDAPPDAVPRCRNLLASHHFSDLRLSLLSLDGRGLR
jgi:uncharacterized protein (UPF0332 family)